MSFTTRLRRDSRALLFIVAAAMALAGPSTAEASTIVLAITNPGRLDVAPGTSVTFSGTITNNMPGDILTSNLFLNFSGYDPDALAPTQLLGSPDFLIASGETSPVIDLFTLDVTLLALPSERYLVDVFVQDSDDGISDISTVSIVTSAVPLPGTIWGMTAALVAVANRARHRKGQRNHRDATGCLSGRYGEPS